MNKLHTSKFPSHHMIKALQMGSDSNRTDPEHASWEALYCWISTWPSSSVWEGKTVPGTPNPRTCLTAQVCELWFPSRSSEKMESKGCSVNTLQSTLGVSGDLGTGTYNSLRTDPVTNHLLYTEHILPQGQKQLLLYHQSGLIVHIVRKSWTQTFL